MYQFTAPDMPTIALFIIALVVLIIFFGALYSLVLAIFQFVFSKWEEAWIKKAWNTIRYTILWVIFCIVILFIFPFILQRLYVPWWENYTANNILAQVGQILSYILTIGWSWDLWVSPNNSEVVSTYKWL